MVTVCSIQEALNAGDDEIISFSDNMCEGDICEIICGLSDNDERYNTKISLKNLKFETRVGILRYFLKFDNLRETSIILNIMNLIKAHGDMGDGFFESDLTICNSLEEFLDVKLELKEDILDFIKRLACWYFSIFRSIHKVETNFLDKAVDIPNVFRIIIMSSDMFILSGICSKAKGFTDENIVFVKNAMDIMDILCSKHKILNAAIERIFKGVENV